MTLVVIFWTVLIVACTYVGWAGDIDEKVCIAAYAFGSVLSAMVISPLPVRLHVMEWRMFAVDGLLLLLFLYFVVRSKRYWPLWTTGLQVMSLVGYSTILSPVRARTDGMTLAIIAYMILATLVIAAHRSRRRRMSSRASPGVS